MEMTGEFRIPASRQRVWEGLNDPDVLKQCIPGCQTLEKVSDTEFNGRVVASVGPVRATFGGKVTLSDLDPPQSYTISGEGSGGVAGFAKGGAKVNLTEDGAATLLTYAVQAQVGGKLAQVGSRLVDGVARKMANDFFGHFAAVMALNNLRRRLPRLRRARGRRRLRSQSRSGPWPKPRRRCLRRNRRASGFHRQCGSPG